MLLLQLGEKMAQLSAIEAESEEETAAMELAVVEEEAAPAGMEERAGCMAREVVWWRRERRDGR